MSLQTIEIALPSDLIEQIDAEVGRDHRLEFLAEVVADAVKRKVTSELTQEAEQDERPGITSTSRFNPIPVKGEPVSVTLLRDRGSY